MCLGPIDPATNLPDETCGEAATKMRFFPHESGVAASAPSSVLAPSFE